MRSNHFKEFKMDKKQVTDLRSELLDSRFGAKSISTIAESKRFPLHEMRDDVAFQIINDELYLDGNARQNLATFCQTWDDENVHKLMDLSINKNWIDKEEYPQSAAIDLRCVNMVADLWHAPAPKNGQAVGTNIGFGRSDKARFLAHEPVYPVIINFGFFCEFPDFIFKGARVKQLVFERIMLCDFNGGINSAVQKRMLFSPLCGSQ